MEGTLIEGKTIDEAIEKACSEFQVPREKLNIEIIAEGNPGFLGIGARKAMIRASLLSIDMEIESLFAPPEAPSPAIETYTPPPAEKKPAPAVDKKPAPTAERQQPPATAERPQARPERPVPVRRETIAGGAPGNTAQSPHQRPPKPHPQPGHASQTAHPAAKPRAQEAAVAPAPQEKTPSAAAVGGDEPAAQKARRILEGLLAHMQIPSPVTVEETEESIVLNIRGDGSGLLIGKRGQNLDAIQYIVNKAVHHTANGNKMIVIDTEEYRKRREESLVALAQRLGEKVRKTKKPVTVGHMNAHDRRVIHMAMQGDETLTTKSRGEGEYRKIVILPARRGAEDAED
jgi:spoIIIJ-associated protein